MNYLKPDNGEQKADIQWWVESETPRCDLCAEYLELIFLTPGLILYNCSQVLAIKILKTNQYNPV